MRTTTLTATAAAPQVLGPANSITTSPKVRIHAIHIANNGSAGTPGFVYIKDDAVSPATYLSVASAATQHSLDRLLFDTPLEIPRGVGFNIVITDLTNSVVTVEWE